VKEGLVPEEISIGDYVLTGGELPALVIIDAAVRWVPGVLGDPESAREDSFTGPLLDFPQYTRPATVRGLSIPDVLTSGDHKAIQTWRRRQALRNTMSKRPDLLENGSWSEQDQKWLDQVRREFDRSSGR